MLRLCVALFSSVLALSSLAAPQVFVVGLFPGAAVLNVDGQRKLVRVGQTGPQGVQVVSADSRKAVLRIDGVERTYELSREYNEAGYSAPQRQSFSIARGTGGHYWVAGSVNGQNMQFLVDTGATSIAMNENEARRLGIDYRVDGKPMVASTASGTSRGWRVTLDPIAEEGRGVLLYLRQEGRGIGLLNKIRAYELQDGGADTVEANLQLGFGADQRDYAMCQPMLAHLGVSSLRLMTNNPRKVKALESYAITVAERVPLQRGLNKHNRRYLATKAGKLGHMLGSLHQGEAETT